jgi:hypothetical protein
MQYCQVKFKSASKVEKVAAISSDTVTAEYVLPTYGSESVMFYDTVDECIEAVKNRTCDATYVNKYSAKKVEFYDEKSQLSIGQITSYSVNLAVVANAKLGKLAISVLSKTAASLSEEFIDRTLTIYSQYGQKDITINSFIYSNPWAVVAGATTIFGLLGFIIVMLSAQKSRQNQKKLIAETARFGSTLCEVYDEVVEFDLLSDKGYYVSVDHG